MPDTVTVACKLPNGLILRTFRLEPVKGPGYMPDEKRSVELERFQIYGNAKRDLDQGEGDPKTIVIGGYALTGGVPKKFWDLWLEQNKDSELVRNKLIFAYAQMASTKSAAKEHRATKSGLERLDPSTKRVAGREVPADYRWPTRGNPNISAIATDVGDQ